ncbi:hypothetical protein SUGI_0341310 [Cryptomeria japonica]|nr:hypothetical protein SUGI_0341310 [Cryptomeria japonica]
MAENFSENDEDYVNSSVIEAAEVKNGSDGFSIIMKDGRHLKCVFNNPSAGIDNNYGPQSAIILKMEDGSDLLLPIIVVESSCMMLMEALRDVQVARPTVYHILKDMIDKMGYEVKLVRVTQRVNQAYFAQLYLNKIGDETEQVSFDLRPSDAINIAVRCKVPIQVNKHIAFSDGMKIIDGFAKVSSRTYKSQDLMTRELDRPDGNTCFATMEFGLVRNMIVAADEERYVDAAKWRDELIRSISKARATSCTYSESLDESILRNFSNSEERSVGFEFHDNHFTNASNKTVESRALGDTFGLSKLIWLSNYRRCRGCGLEELYYSRQKNCPHLQKEKHSTLANATDHLKN